LHEEGAIPTHKKCKFGGRLEMKGSTRKEERNKARVYPRRYLKA